MKITGDQMLDYLGMVGILLFLTGLVFSPFLLSIATIILFLYPFVRSGLLKTVRKIRYERYSFFFLIYFFIVLLSGLVTSDFQEFLNDIKVKLPFVFIAVAALSFDKFLNKKKIIYIFLFFESALFLAGLFTLINYLGDPELYNHLIMAGKPIPVYSGVNHIYYSFMLAFGVAGGFVLSWKYISEKSLKWTMYLLAGFNFIILHLIGARTGLLGLYFGLAVYAVLIGIVKKKLLLTLTLLIAMTALWVLAIAYIHPLKNRYLKTIEDYNVYKSGEDINHYSLSMRLEYWEKSFKVFLTHPITGTGFGDVHNDMRKLFTEEHSELIKINQKGPHNQFLEVMAGSGIPGLLILLILLFYPLRAILIRQDELHLFFIAIVFIAFLFESVLERQVGISFFTFFSLFLFKSRNIFNPVKDHI